MTKKEIEKLGFRHVIKDYWFHPDLGVEIYIDSLTRIQDIFQRIYSLAFELGIMEGEDRKVKQIKELLKVKE